MPPETHIDVVVCDCELWTLRCAEQSKLNGEQQF